MPKVNQWLALAGFIAVCLAVGALGGYATASPVTDWYPTLRKPSWNPPNWLFGPVWTTLYIMMAAAAWLVWRRGQSRAAMILFFTQLALNLAWSFLFFGVRSPWLGLVGVVILWLALLATVIVFFQRDRLAGWLMLPYLAWVSFAAFLNFTIWQLN
jgi:tryptophan-rich sensory protein